MAKTATATKSEVEVIINPYELMLILDPELRESEVKKKLKEIEGMITKAGGKITHDDLWGKRELAYRIKKHHEGIYMVYNLELPNHFPKELSEMFRIEKEIIRSMLIKLPADYTYTKYELETKEEKVEKPHPQKYVSIKHAPPIAPKKIKEEKIEEKEEKGKEVDKSELDKKLDEIIGGEDLNL